MKEPNWDRWHELLTIRDMRGLNQSEQAEYDEFKVIVDKEDAEEERISREHIEKLQGKMI